mgnify:CR=1 FL=1
MTRIGLFNLKSTILLLSQMGNQNQAMIFEMDKHVNSLQSQWEGVAHQDFFIKIQEWRKVMETSINLLKEIGEQMDQIQKRFESIDMSE